MPDQLCRPIGIRLASVVQSRSKQALHTNTLQALVADLAGEQADLIMPLRDLVSRPAFRALIPLAGSGKGQLQRDALIEDVARTFAPPVVTAMRAVVDGFLAVPSHTPPPSQTATAGSWDIPETVVMPGTHAEGAGETSWPQEGHPPGNSREAHQAGSRSIVQLAGIAALCAALMAGGLAVLRSTWLCEPLGWCKAESSDRGASAQNPGDLQRAQKAAQAMDDADSLEAHESALRDLEQALNALEGQSLSPETITERNRLQAEAQTGRKFLSEERAHQKQVQQAAQLLKDPSKADPSSLQATTASLESIPARSFAAGEAGRLKADLARLQPKRESPATQATTPTSQPPALERPPIRAQIPYTPPPAARPQPSRTPTASSEAPYREEPLW